MKYLLALLFTMFLANPALSLSQGKYYKVTRLYVWTNGDAHVWFERGGEHKCNDQTYSNRYILHSKAVHYDAKFALLLSAKITEGGINMNYTCNTKGIPYIDAIRF